MSEVSKWVAIARELGPTFAEKAAANDENDAFVADNYGALKERGVFSAAVPAELGGGGASVAELAAMIRELAHHCSSTALAASMHTHVVGSQAFLWRSGNKASEPMLRRVATENLVLATSGGSDWLAGSGTLTRVEGGFRMTGRKIFSSGVPAANVLTTTGVLDDPKDGPTVIHFAVPLNAPGVKVLDTWRVLGMRATGSHDVELHDVFIPEATAGLRRPAGKWHPSVFAVSMIALPIMYAAYLGVAEAARDVALAAARKRVARDPDVAALAGEMEEQLVTAQSVHAGMVAAAETEKPSATVAAAQLARRGVVAAAAIRTVEKAMEVAGGGAFYRSAQLERLFRDVQAGRYHPMQDKPRTRFVGRVLLGLDIDG